MALWLHFFWCLVPSWRFGEYYQYGFLVPLLALGFTWRRVGVVGTPQTVEWPAGRVARSFLILMLVTLSVVMLFLRIIETGDPRWRPPLILHGLIVTVVTHLVLARLRGWRVSMFFFPVTVFAWSSVPYFWQLEQALVRCLTGWVIGFTQEIFLLCGSPVERAGESLVMGDQIVDVTDGCSGIRSIQSLVMAALFFGELLWLRWTGRVALVGAGLLAAVSCNTGRAWYLANIQFSRGESAAHAAHDPAGHLAFAAAAIGLYLAALLLVPRANGRLVVRRIE